MNDLGAIIELRRTDRILKRRIRQPIGVHKVADEIINGSRMRWYRYMKKVNKNKMAKRILKSQLNGMRMVDKLRKRWII